MYDHKKIWRCSINTSSSPAKGITSFIPGLALFKGMTPILLRSEFVVAITIFAVLVPSAMAYGDLAGVTPVSGLYVSLGALLMYALFGTSKQLMMGPDPTSAIMVAAAVAPLAGGDAARYAALAAMVAVLVGILCLLARLARLGFITDFLSKPILVGYIFGVAFITIGSQLGKMFGVSLESDKFFQQVLEMISRLDEAHLLTVAIGIVCMAALFIMRRISPKFPGPLVVVVVAIISSVAFDLQARGVAVVGKVPAGLPQVTVPTVTFQDILALLPSALAIMILVFADGILTSRVYAKKHGQKIDANQEFVALGMANIGAGLLTGFPAAISGSRTAVDDQMGGKTQWVGLFAAALTIIFLLFFTPLLAPLPKVALGAIIIVASLGLVDIAAFRFLRKVRPSEFWLAIVTAWGVLCVGLLWGILVAVALSLVLILYRMARPHDALLDDVDASGGTVYRGVYDKETTMTEPGLIVYRFDAPLVFANAAFFAERLEELVVKAGEGLKCVVLDADAISDFDSTAAEALETLDADLERHGVELWIARANAPLRELLQVTGITGRIGRENMYPSVRAAVLAYHDCFGTP
jgi:sulfate permease, SulP family